MESGEWRPLVVVVVECGMLDLIEDQRPAGSPRFWWEGSRIDTVAQCRGLITRIHPLIVIGADIMITRCDFRPDRRSAMETCSGMHGIDDWCLRRKTAVDIDLLL